MSVEQHAAVAGLELELLLAGVARAYGVDVRSAPLALIERTVGELRRAAGLATVAALIDKVLRDRSYGERAAAALGKCLPRLFADPAFYRMFNGRVVPWLRTYPYVSIWIAQCGAGGEVYSLAVLLEEAGLYERTYVYATDESELCIARAMEGTLGPVQLDVLEERYRASGGRRSLADYLEQRDAGAVVTGSLKSRIVWSEYNLATGESFNEFAFISCRNVIPHLAPMVQQRVYRLVTDSLPVFGLVALDAGAALDAPPYKHCYKEFDRSGGLHQRIS